MRRAIRIAWAAVIWLPVSALLLISMLAVLVIGVLSAVMPAEYRHLNFKRDKGGKWRHVHDDHETVDGRCPGRGPA